MSSPPEHLRGDEKPHGVWLMRRIWDRINRRNMHFMAAIVGQEGSGKSYTALKIANLVDPSFSADRVIFDIADLLDVLKNGEHEPGNFYILDEAGVQLGNRTWQDRGQVLANQALQLIRSHNLGLIFTLPRLGELDSQAQGRLQSVVEMVDKVDGEHVEVKWKLLEPDRMDETGTIYKKYPRRRVDGRLLKINRFKFTPPPDTLTQPYEATKGEFQEQFYEETIEELSDDTGDDEEESVDPSDVADDIISAGVSQYISEHGQTGRRYVDKDLLRAEFDLSHADANAAKKLVERQVEEIG